MTVTTESRTELSDVEVAGSVVATDRYPVTEPGSAVWAHAVAAARRELDDQGCCVLRDFVRPRLHARLAEEGAGIAAIFSYSERPGVVGQAERTRQLFGRLTPAHEPGVPGTRVDALLD